MEKIIIAAVAENRTIGKDGDIPWHLPEDLKRFKRLTTGHPVVMGRKTFESLPDSHRPLSDRTNIVLTRSGFDHPDESVKTANSLEEAYSIAEELDNELFIIGGSAIYKQTLGDADKLLLTEVHERYDGDSFFPEIDDSNWKETEREKRNGFDFVNYIRTS